MYTLLSVSGNFRMWLVKSQKLTTACMRNYRKLQLPRWRTRSSYIILVPGPENSYFSVTDYFAFTRDTGLILNQAVEQEVYIESVEDLKNNRDKKKGDLVADGLLHAFCIRTAVTEEFCGSISSCRLEKWLIWVEVETTLISKEIRTILFTFYPLYFSPLFFGEICSALHFINIFWPFLIIINCWLTLAFT